MAIDRTAGQVAGLKTNLPAGAPAGALGSVGSQPTAADGAAFKRALEQVVAKAPTGVGPTGASAQAPNDLKFSNHAVERMRSRGIAFAPEEMSRISAAINKAAAKGAKDTLVLSGENALIVSVKNKTVVTVMDRAAMKENVFTNIDSTVVI